MRITGLSEDPRLSARSAQRAAASASPRFGIIFPVLMPPPNDPKQPPKGPVDRFMRHGQKAFSRVLDAFLLTAAGTVLPIIGHATLWPLALGVGGLAVKNLAEGAGLQLPANNPLVRRINGFERATTKASQVGMRWSTPITPVVLGALGLTLVSLLPLLHALMLLAGPALAIGLAVQAIAYGAGFAKSMTQDALKALR